jgi:hypothetical protein
MELTLEKMPDDTATSRDRIPPGSVEWVLEVLRKEKGPMKRRRILEELEGRGHRISLAGLNRILEVCSREKRTVDGPNGVSLAPGK